VKKGGGEKRKKDKEKMETGGRGEDEIQERRICRDSRERIVQTRVRWKRQRIKKGREE
jgi:hypothetical protein